MRKIVLIVLALTLGLAPAAMADSMADLAQARQAISEGNLVQSIDLMRSALRETWNNAPLAVQNVTYVTEVPQGYGMYTPREGDEFSMVEPILVYCEPVGYTVVQQGDLNHFSISADFAVFDSEGVELGGQQGLGPWEHASRNFNMEFMVFFTFNVSGLPIGDYTIRVTLHDGYSDKTTTFEKPILIRQ